MKDLIRQFILFCGVGAINTIIGLAIILLLSEVFHVHYILANISGYGVGLTIGFFLHKNITFKGTSNRARSRAEFLSFAGIFAVAYLVQLGVLILMVQWLGIPQMAAQILAIGIYTVLNYLGNRMITFRSSMKGT